MRISARALVTLASHDSLLFSCLCLLLRHLCQAVSVTSSSPLDPIHLKELAPSSQPNCNLFFLLAINITFRLESLRLMMQL